MIQSSATSWDQKCQQVRMQRDYNFKPYFWISPAESALVGFQVDDVRMALSSSYRIWPIRRLAQSINLKIV